MKKAPDAFRTISEVADWLDVQAHVLRFWESKFAQVKPVKRAGGRRYYRPSDMLLIGGIKNLLHDQGMTIKGVQKILREKGVEHVSSLSKEIDFTDTIEVDAIADPPPEADAAAPVDATPVADEPAQETPETTPNVVTFQSRKARARSAEPVVEPAAVTTAPEVEPDGDGDASEDAANLRPNGVDPAPVEPAAEAPVVAAEPENDPEPEAESPAASVASEPDLFDDDLPDQPNLPSFLHRSARAAPEPEPESVPEPEPEALPPAPRVIDAPDPPPEDEIEAVPGVLGQLAALSKLPPASIEPLRAMADEIRGRIGQENGAA